MENMIRFLRGLKNKMKKTKNVICFTCNSIIHESKGNEYFGINWKEYCSLGCYREDDEKERRAFKISSGPQTNKINKSKNQIQQKRSKQKKRSK